MPNSGGNAAIFGFLFQVGAAIVLMVENIDRLKTIKFDGKHEDIEIKLDDDTYIVAQAKSAMNPAKSNNVIAKLKKALSTLSRTDNSIHPEQLIYVTNILNPLQEIYSQSMLVNNQSIHFLDLPEPAQQVIRENLPTDEQLDVNKLTIRRINFYSNDPHTRFRAVIDCIEELLTKCQFVQRGKGKELKDIWLNDLFNNGANLDLNITKNKNDIVWPIIVLCLDFNRDYIAKNFSDCDDGEIEQISNEYRNIITSNTERFLFVTRVISDYNDCRKDNANIKINDFVNEYWEQYTEEFEIEIMDADVRKKLIKIILNLILKNRFLTKNIMEEVNLCTSQRFN